jgi:hypothetical protein
MRPGGRVEAAEGVQADHGETTLGVVCHREEVYFEGRTGAGRKDPKNMQQQKNYTIYTNNF